jgi:hypothetical protein
MSERLAYILTFDTSSGVKSLEKVGATADKELGKVDKRLDKIGAGMTKFGAGAMAVAGVVGVGLYKLAQNASDLGEAVSKAGEIFGDSSNEIEKFGASAAKSFGLSKREAVDAASRFGIFGRAAKLTGSDLTDFSVDLTKLAADMGSFNNVPTAEVLEAISSALAGQSRPMQRFGVLLGDATLKARALEMGIYDGTGALTGQQKVLATHAEILAQTTVQSGDFARTLGESLPNQAKVLGAELENLRAGIGEGVLPMFLGMTSAASGLVGKFNEMSDGNKKLIGTVASTGTALLAFAGAASFVIGKLILMRDRFEAVGISAGKMKGAVGIAGLALVAYALHAKTAADRAAQAAKSIDDLGRAADAELLRAFGRALAANALEAGGMAEGMARIARESPGAIARLLEMEDATGELTAGMIANGVSTERAAEHVAMMRQALEDEKVARENHTRTLEAGTEAVDGNTGALDENADATDAAAEAADRLAAAQKRAQDRTKNLRDEIFKGIDNAYDYEKANLALADQVDKLAEAELKLDEVMQDANSTTTEKEAALRNLRKEQISTAEGARTQAEAYAREKGAADGSRLAAVLQIEEYKRLQDKYPELRGEIQGYIDKLLEVPGVVPTRIELDTSGANRSLDDLVRKLNSLGSIGATQQSILSANRFRQRATGGHVRTGETTLVGEDGPELVNLPPGSKVNTAQQTAALGASTGGNTYVTINTQADPQMVVDAIRKWERRNGPMR